MSSCVFSADVENLVGDWVKDFYFKLQMKKGKMEVDTCDNVCEHR